MVGLNTIGYFVSKRRLILAYHGTINLDPSLVASTFLGSLTERMAFCQFCREVDHNWEECALRSIRDPLPISNTTPIPGPSDPQSEGRRRRRQAICPRPETLDRICVSWNKGRCAYPGSCTFWHRCATCRQPGHIAHECADTPEDSEYRQPHQSNRGRGEGAQPNSQGRSGGPRP